MQKGGGQRKTTAAFVGILGPMGIRVRREEERQMFSALSVPFIAAPKKQKQGEKKEEVPQQLFPGERSSARKLESDTEKGRSAQRSTADTQGPKSNMFELDWFLNKTKKKKKKKKTHIWIINFNVNAWKVVVFLNELNDAHTHIYIALRSWSINSSLIKNAWEDKRREEKKKYLTVLFSLSAGLIADHFTF